MKLAMGKVKNWIFVSGAIRSGTTFTGRVLSLPSEVDYIHEPYNQSQFKFGNLEPCPYVRLEIDTEEMQTYHQFTKRLFQYDIKLPNYIPENDPWFKRISKLTLGSRGPFYLRLARLNYLHKAAVIKDPIAIFLAEYLYTYFKVKPVILIKHPISFVVSLKRKNWWENPSKLANQHDLIKDYFADEPDYFLKQWSSPLEAAAAYWRIIYKILLSQSNKYTDWHIVKHEEMSQSPLTYFNDLYQALDLPWSKAIEQKIINMTDGSGKNKVTQNKIHSLRRNSSEIFNASVESLTLEEREMIFNVVQDVALQIYPRSSFSID